MLSYSDRSFYAPGLPCSGPRRRFDGWNFEEVSMSAHGELNSMTFSSHEDLFRGPVVLVNFLPEVGPRFDIWAFPAAEIVSSFAT